VSFYEERVLPHLTHLAMRQRVLRPYRERVLAGAEGRVLEIGVGSGVNLPLYSGALKEVVGIEPSPALRSMAERAAEQAEPSVRLLDASAESIPLDDRSVDTVVMTWTLCSITDVEHALAEMRRVLRPGGRLLFVEHGQAPDAWVRWWQERLTPMWRRFGGGCHLGRPIPRLIESGRFQIEHLAAGYLKGRNPTSYMFEGSARPC
jgi:ubiquinone/menaquinone biosynthesis C-methylase UbiE